MTEDSNRVRASASRLLWVLILGFGLTGGALLDRMALPAQPPAGGSPGFSLLEEAWNRIHYNYVDRAALQPQALTYGAIAGMVDALGDTGHSRFLTPQTAKRLSAYEKNQFSGVGAEVQMKDGHVVIVAPISDSPAQRAGLRPGDIILKVNGHDVSNRSLDQVVEAISGPADTRVNLTILSPHTSATREVPLVRAVIHVHNVAWMRLPESRVADVHLASFNEGASDELRRALAAIRHEGLRGIVLDLRNDPGGLLVEAIKAASQFLSAGNVLLEKNADGRVKPVPVRPGGLATEIPVVVLVNGGTASAAEIVAGALQDAHRGRLVGQKSFGTGTVLGEFGLSDGSKLLLAIEEWLTPAGHVIWHKGITPDVAVALPADADLVFPETDEHLTAAQLHVSKDAQLLRALELLEQR